MLKVCKSLDDEFVELVKKAEEEDDMSLVMKSEEKSKNVSSLEEVTAIISEKKSKYKVKFDTRITDIMFQLFFLIF